MLLNIEKEFVEHYYHLNHVYSNLKESKSIIPFDMRLPVYNQ